MAVNSDPKIKLLPEDLTNKIAAGEVVERPASVIKELIENSIDAGATEITVVVRDGGRTLLQVVDNGSGMNAADAQMCFQRHATSKIYDQSGLENIRTLGFRGEALASIASVSQVTLKTMEPDASEATIVELDGGIQTNHRIAAGTPGTSITIKNLFYNTPGRRKFVKAATTEYRKILEVVHRFAIGYPSIHFTLVHNDDLIIEVQTADSLEERLFALYGSRLKGELIAIADNGPACQISGVVGKQNTVRKSRGEQFLFLNQRYIVDRSLNHAVVSAYGEILAHGGFPFYVVMLQVDPLRVDVNVHPTKMEVKFADDRLIYAIVRSTVRSALNSAAVIPEEGRVMRNIPVVNLQPSVDAPHDTSATPLSLESAGELSPSGDFRAQHPGRQLGFNLPARPEVGRTEPTPIEIAAPVESEVYTPNNVWQVHNRYIFAEIKSGLLIIDQHVAHERILFEQALATFAQEEGDSQNLLFPLVCELSASDYDIAVEMLPFLNKIGFAIKPFGRLTLLIEGVPPGARYAKRLQDTKVLTEIIDEYKRGKRDKLEIRDNIAASYACHSAIRSGDRLNLASMNALIDQLFATKSPYFCPHGRPVIVNIPLEELDKRFGRT